MPNSIFSEKDAGEIFELILDNIPDYITIVDANCKTVFFNKACEEYYKLSKEEIIGKDLRDFFPNSLLPKVVENEKRYDNVYNSPRENSYTVISALPLYDSDGKLVGGLARDKDITELVNLSTTLNKTQVSLSKLERKYSEKEEGNSFFSNIIGESKALAEIINLSKSVSKTPMNILLYGESGVGKELFAKAIHYHSDRKGKYVEINCSAIPPALFESELFGYEEGAFTGAKKEGKIGKFEEANGGTLFLDEIGDMPMHLQPKILRALEDGYITKIGSNVKKTINVRIISATNKDVKTLIEKGKFRRDLYYRLDAFKISIPPLRERGEDVILIANAVLEQFCTELGYNILTISKDAAKALLDHVWEGNVRELKNVIQRSAVFAFQDNSDEIKASYLSGIINELERDNVKKIDKHANNIIPKTLPEEAELFDLTESVAKLEKEMIQRALILSGFNLANAAKLLKIPRTTLYYKIEKYNIQSENF